LRRRLNPLKEHLVPHGIRAGGAKRVALQDMGQHPEMGQQDLGCEIGWFRKVGELVGVHVVGYGI
jgi:hypothetical protein